MVSTVRTSLRRRAQKVTEEEERKGEKVVESKAKDTGLCIQKNGRSISSEAENARTNPKENSGQKGQKKNDESPPRVKEVVDKSNANSSTDTQKRGRPLKPKNNENISTPLDSDADLVPVVPDQGDLSNIDASSSISDQVPKELPRKRGRPRKYPIREGDASELPLKPLDSNEPLAMYSSPKAQSTPPQPKVRCEDCNAILKGVPENQMLCNDCHFDPTAILDDDCDDDFTISSRKKGSTALEERNRRKRTRTLSHPNENEMPNILAESPRPNEEKTFHTSLSCPPPTNPFPRVTSPTPSSHSYVSDFDGPLPKKFPCPTIVPEQQYCNQQAAYFYPSPAALDEPLDRMEFMISRIHEMDQFQLAQVLCSLDIDTRREFDRALQIRRDASLDVATLNNQTWSSICSIFANHMD